MPPIVSKEWEKAFLRAKMSWDATVVGGVDSLRSGMVLLGVAVLKVGLSFVQ